MPPLKRSTLQTAFMQPAHWFASKTSRRSLSQKTHMGSSQPLLICLVFITALLTAVACSSPPDDSAGTSTPGGGAEALLLASRNNSEDLALASYKNSSHQTVSASASTSSSSTATASTGASSSASAQSSVLEKKPAIRSERTDVDPVNENLSAISDQHPEAHLFSLPEMQTYENPDTHAIITPLGQKVNYKIIETGEYLEMSVDKILNTPQKISGVDAHVIAVSGRIFFKKDKPPTKATLQNRPKLAITTYGIVNFVRPELPNSALAEHFQALEYHSIEIKDFQDSEDGSLTWYAWYKMPKYSPTVTNTDSATIALGTELFNELHTSDSGQQLLLSNPRLWATSGKLFDPSHPFDLTTSPRNHYFVYDDYVDGEIWAVTIDYMDIADGEDPDRDYKCFGISGRANLLRRDFDMEPRNQASDAELIQLFAHDAARENKPATQAYYSSEVAENTACKQIYDATNFGLIHKQPLLGAVGMEQRWSYFAEVTANVRGFEYLHETRSLIVY